MEDDKIKDLFSNFQPALPTDDAVFLSRLRQNLDAVEVVKEQMAARRRRSKIAVAVAATVGFVSGVATTLFIPTISHWLSSLPLPMHHVEIAAISLDSNILLWIIPAVLSGLIAYNTYQVTLSRLSSSPLRE